MLLHTARLVSTVREQTILPRLRFYSGKAAVGREPREEPKPSLCLQAGVVIVQKGGGVLKFPFGVRSWLLRGVTSE